MAAGFQRQPALVGEDGGLIAGHARILAARQFGIAAGRHRLLCGDSTVATDVEKPRR